MQPEEPSLPIANEDSPSSDSNLKVTKKSVSWSTSMDMDHLGSISYSSCFKRTALRTDRINMDQPFLVPSWRPSQQQPDTKMWTFVQPTGAWQNAQKWNEVGCKLQLKPISKCLTVTCGSLIYQYIHVYIRLMQT